MTFRTFPQIAALVAMAAMNWLPRRRGGRRFGFASPVGSTRDSGRGTIERRTFDAPFPWVRIAVRERGPR
jgi:hypothetical protein